MKEKFQCPGEHLEIIVNGLNEARFFLNFRIPDRNRIRENLGLEGDPIFDFEDNLFNETNRIYDEENKHYKKAQDFRDAFYKIFGINPKGASREDLEEIRNRVYGILKRHVEDCSSCRNSYLGYLTIEGETLANELDEQYKDYSIEELVKVIDNSGLNLMGF